MENIIEHIWIGFERFVFKVGLFSKQQEHPSVKDVVPDPDNKGVYIVTVEDSGTPLPLPLPVALDKNVRALERYLRAEAVYDISFGATTNQARFKIKLKEGVLYEDL